MPREVGAWKPTDDDYAVTAYQAETALNTGRLQAALNVIARLPLPAEKAPVFSVRDILLVKSLAHELLNDTRAANQTFAMLKDLGEGKSDEKIRGNATYKRIIARIGPRDWDAIAHARK